MAIFLKFTRHGLIFIRAYEHYFSELYSAIYFSLGVLWAILTMVVICGLVMYAYFRDCDPIFDDRVEKADQVTSQHHF